MKAISIEPSLPVFFLSDCEGKNFRGGHHSNALSVHSSALSVHSHVKDTTVGALLRDDVRYFKMLASTNCGEGEIEETHLVTNPVVAFRFKDHVDRS